LGVELTTLVLGVIDLPYGTTPTAPRRVKVRRTVYKNARGAEFTAIHEYSVPASGAETTGDVAEFLENRYHVMETFFELHSKEIITAFEEVFVGNLENIALGAPVNDNAMAEATSKTEALFKQFISNAEMDGIQPGVPTAAALKGINHRLAHPYAKGNPQRPSFRDTGLYQSSMKAWVET
jgi:hypothetical protein